MYAMGRTQGTMFSGELLIDEAMSIPLFGGKLLKNALLPISIDGSDGWFA